MRAVVAWLLLTGSSGCGDNQPPPLAWGVGVTTFDAVELGLTSSAVQDRFASEIISHQRLVIPTYDGSGQAVHPDALREADRVLMAITPYPYSNNRFENPSLVLTHDGMRFEELRPGLNPLVQPPSIDHNNDPDLHIDPATGEYEILYLETLRPDTQRLISLRSRDLETWMRTTAIDWNLAAGAPFVVSPAVIVHDGKTTMFDVRLTANGNMIERYESADGRTWDATSATPIALDTGGIIAWHVDALVVPNGYALLINGYTDDFDVQDLFLATSADLQRWTLRREPLLAHDEVDLDLRGLYRSTGFVAGDRLVVWYSQQYRE